MIHVAKVGFDPAGRSVIDSRVLDVDPEDGLNQASRVNSAIDVMQAASADAADTPATCVAVRRSDESTELHRGTGRRRRVRVVDENLAVISYLSSTGLLGSYESVMVIDCGDSGMTMFTTSPRAEDATDVVRTGALSGQELDKRIAATVADEHGWLRRPTDEQVAACRTAKEELFSTEERPSVGHVRVRIDDVSNAAQPLIAAAAQEVSRYVGRGGAEPQLIIVVGGLANIPQVVEGLGEAAGIPAVAAPSPELAAAIGAALTAREADSGITKLTMIGGRRNRDWLSTAPLIVVGVSIGVIAMSIYASGSLTSSESPFVPSNPSPPVVSDASNLTTRTTAAGDFGPQGEATLTPDAPNTGAGPGWATTQLNPTTSVRTRTLVPTTLPTGPSSSSSGQSSSKPSTSGPSTSTTTSPSLPFVPPGVPLPPYLIPSGLFPSPSPAPRPQNAPADSDQPQYAPRTPPPAVVPQR
ncbi:hypothetical protein GOEFS_094_00520 [Gordonia effusa NBRC 100432]|uniref:Uncharacterized protein n=2 Tax=Gordonia effusa TaxID=263908 RepID=H0R3V2_9ACTN|nr:hypothetical protein GOEFS_094_00520 [Gordonia effusa NBRC 100432]